MTSAEITKLLETFRARYTPDVEVLDPNLVRLWNEQFRDTDRDVMRVAAKRYLADHPPSESFPKPAALRWYVREASDDAQGRTEPSPGKPAASPPTPRGGRCDPPCDRGWRTSTVVETAVASRPTKGPDGKLDGPDEAYDVAYPAAVYPCPTCDPGGYDRWHDQWVPEANRMRPVKSTDLFTFNPVHKLAEARSLNQVLATVSTITRDANDLTDLDRID